MMVNRGKFNYPPGEDEAARMIRDLSRDVSETGASVAKSLAPMIPHMEHMWVVKDSFTFAIPVVWQSDNIMVPRLSAYRNVMAMVTLRYKQQAANNSAADGCITLNGQVVQFCFYQQAGPLVPDSDVSTGSYSSFCNPGDQFKARLAINNGDNGQQITISDFHFECMLVYYN